MNKLSHYFADNGADPKELMLICDWDSPAIFLFFLSNLKTLLIYLISKKKELCYLIEGTTFLVLVNTRASESSLMVEKR